MSQDLGMDRSGNGNNWTVNNITYADQMLDVPKNNYCTLNPLHHDIDNHGNNLNRVYSEGNLKISTDTVAGVSSTFFGTMGVTSGKWYYEAMTIAGGNVGAAIGIANYNGGDNMYYYSNGNKYYDGGSASYGASYANLDVVGVAFNADTNAITFYKNGVSQGEITSAITGGGHYFPAGWDGSGSLFALLVYNFGQDSSFAGNKTAQGKRDSEGIGDFYYNVPSGYKALCTKNLPDVAVVPSEHFNTVLWSGDGASSRAITGVGFQPDFVWGKPRSQTASHILTDSVRGVTKNLLSNGTASEYTTTVYSSFDTDGFTLGANAPGWWYNHASHTSVAWNWKANGSGSSNTNGSITSTVSANVDAGFSIVSATYSGSGTKTFGHGLSSAPELIIGKNRSAVANWGIYNSTIGAGKYLLLDTTGAEVASTTIWSNTAPTSTVFSSDVGWLADAGNDVIFYCFHSVEGYSKIGSYTGNGKADGTFAYTGFRPAYVMIKCSSSSTHAHWFIFDSVRQTYNVIGDVALAANLANTEGLGGTWDPNTSGAVIDFLSNGFKIRTTSTHGISASGATHTYLAFAETPFKYSNAR